MSLTDESGMNTTMLVSPTGGYQQGGFGNGFGGDGWWIILLLLLAGGGWGNGFGGYGGGQLGYDFPWLMNGQQGINNNVSSGFRDAQISDGITSVRDGISALSTQICGGFAGVNATVNNGFAQAEIANNSRQMANMQQMFANQMATTQGFNQLGTQFANCCCENRLGIANLGSDIAREACATRTTDTQNTQAILNAVNTGVQSIKDQLCQDKIDAKNDEIAQLRQEISMKDLAASQVAQNAFIQNGFTNEVDQLYNRLSSCPVPSTPVYGRTPIFTCNQNSGCGCNGGF